MFQSPFNNQNVTVTFSGFSDFNRNADFNVSKGGAPLTGITGPRYLFSQTAKAGDLEKGLHKLWHSIDHAVTQHLAKPGMNIESMFDYTIYVGKKSVSIKKR